MSCLRVLYSGGSVANVGGGGLARLKEISDFLLEFLLDAVVEGGFNGESTTSNDRLPEFFFELSSNHQNKMRGFHAISLFDLLL